MGQGGKGVIMEREKWDREGEGRSGEEQKWGKKGRE